VFFRDAGGRTTVSICLVAIVTLGFALSCSRQPRQDGTVRLALLRFENLSADPAADWIGRALPELIGAAVGADPGVYALPAQRIVSTNAVLGSRNLQAPGISSERPLALALRAGRLGYGEYYLQGGQLHARLTLEDAATGKAAGVFAASAPAGDVASLAGSLARRISARAVVSSTGTEALRLYSQALESGNPSESIALLERAIAAAPDFGPPYRYLAEWKARSRDAAAAARVLEAAISRGASLGDVERVRAELALATLRNDAAARRRAAAALTALRPQDPALWQTLAEAATLQQDYAAAAQAYQRLVAVEPADVNAWNQLGYALCFSGDLPGAMEALRRYQALRPADANVVDSMGDVNLIHGKFSEAEKLYLENARKNARFLNGIDILKAAMARLMSGDAAGADQLAKEYAAGREQAQDPAVGVYRAEWTWLSGKRKQACAEIEAFARTMESTPAREVAAGAYAELALWRLMLGERDAARQAASRAVPLAGPSSAALAGIAQLLSAPSATSGEWEARVTRFLPNAPEGSFKNVVLGYALLFEKDFRGAASALAGYAGISITSNDPAPWWALAWARMETGQQEEAASALRWFPVPPATGPGAFAALYFPRVFYLRGVLAQKQGKTQEARTNFKRFLDLSGQDPLVWGEEAKAKAAL
jgi:tetratricopeptide (TPR) repeat protein